MSSPCPGNAVLVQFLSGGLADSRELSRHIDQCSSCQRVLDAITRASTLRGVLISGWSQSRPEGSPATAPNGSLAGSFLGPPQRDGDLGTLAGYLIEDRLGEGGMGLVYGAFDPKLARAVAIKVLRSESGDDLARSRFVEEGRALASVSSDHVVAVFAVVDTPETPACLVMERLDGPTLAREMAARGRLPIRDAVDVFIDVAQGLAAAHERGLIHRDVKPSNMMFDRVTSRWKLMDFGLAWNRLSAKPELGATGLAGTPAYMSPEQASGEPLDGRSDIYNLGLSLYEVLTGEVPFRGESHLVLRRIQKEEPRPPRLITDSIPRDLEIICLKAIAKDPRSRYQTVVDFATDLRRWRNGEPIRARPAGLFERSWLWARRNRMVAALTTCLTVVLMGAFTGLVLLWRIAERGAAVTRVQAFQTNQQRLAAEENLASALSAFDQFSQFVLDEEQLKRPDLVELRRRVAVRWAENYRRLLERQEPDSQLWESLAEGHARIGQTMAMAGSTTESIAAWSQAVQLLQELDRLQPGKRTVLDRLARGQMHLGQLLTGRDDTVAKQTLLQARETAARLLAAEPNESRHRLRWASCQGALSRVATQQGEHQAALELIREARDELFELVRLHPDNVGFLQNLGVAEQNLGLARERAGSGPEQALQDLDRALELRERLVQDGLASSPWDRMNLAKTHGARGEFFKKQGESTRANESFQRAQEIHEAVLDDLPGSVEYRRSFIALLVQRAQFFEELDEREASASFWRRGLDEVLPRLVSNQETEVLPPEAEIPVLPLADFCLREGETNLVTRLASYILERLDRETHTPPARSLGVRLRIAAISRIAMASLLEQRWAEAAADLTKALDAWNLLVDIAPGSADSGLPSIPTIAELQLLLAQALCHLEKTDSADRLLSTAKPFEREPRPAWDSLLSAAWNDELVRKLGSHIPDTNECSKPDN